MKGKKDKIIASSRKVETRLSVAQRYRIMKNSREIQNPKREGVGREERRLVRIIG